MSNNRRRRALGNARTTSTLYCTLRPAPLYNEGTGRSPKAALATINSASVPRLLLRSLATTLLGRCTLNSSSVSSRRLCCSAFLPTAVLAVLFSFQATAAEEPAYPSIESKYLSNIRQVSEGFVKAGEGYFSPDGKQIIFQAQPRDYPFYQIYTQPLDGKTPARLISTGRGRTTCSYFSPDGRRVIFASSHLDPMMSETEEAAIKQAEEDAKSGRRRRYSWDFDPHTEIFEAALDGSDLRRLTNAPGYDAEGAYTPDGKSIVFCSDRDGDPDLYVMDADGGNVRQLTNEPGYDGGPFTSPDGRWVIYRSDRKQAEFLQIHAIGLDGQHDVALTDNVGVNWAPYWHPTEPYIIWTGADHSDPQARPNYDLWLMKYEVTDEGLKPGPITRITDSPGADVLPVFSPDGKKLMWTSTRTPDHSSQLFEADFTLPE
ncbi:MAG: PD40 domain-containing protein [Pirellulales bacterium]|nr:PD40 domain-containing protein [Pirellulales bacterium]